MVYVFIIYSSLIHYIKSRRTLSKLLIRLIFVHFLLRYLKETKHVLSGLLHKDILTRLLSIPIDIVNGFLKYSPALCHRQVDLVLIRTHISAIGPQNNVMIGVFLVLAGDKYELNLVNTCEQRLDDPSRHFARVVLHLLGQTLSGHLIKGSLPALDVVFVL